VAAGEPLTRQPGLVVLDAGGNRVLDPPVTVSASLAHDNVTAVRDATPPTITTPALGAIPMDPRPWNPSCPRRVRLPP
jgi:hypothetical protein